METTREHVQWLVLGYPLTIMQYSLRAVNCVNVCTYIRTYVSRIEAPDIHPSTYIWGQMLTLFIALKLKALNSENSILTMYVQKLRMLHWCIKCLVRTFTGGSFFMVVHTEYVKIGFK